MTPHSRSTPHTHKHSCLAISWKAALSSRCRRPLRRTTPTTLSDEAGVDEPDAAVVDELCLVHNVWTALSTSCGGGGRAVG